MRELLPGERAYEVGDGGNGRYVLVSPSGSGSFRYNYRLRGRLVGSSVVTSGP